MNEIFIAEQSEVEDENLGSFLTSMEMLEVLNEEKRVAFPKNSLQNQLFLYFGWNYPTKFLWVQIGTRFFL